VRFNSEQSAAEKASEFTRPRTAVHAGDEIGLVR
jgi:hypothetical protein